MRRRVFCIALAALLVLVTAGQGLSEVYRYRDRNGTECFTDDINSVPEEYRKKAAVVHLREEKDRRTPSGATGQLAGAEEGSATEKQGLLNIITNSGIARSGLVVAVFLVLFVVAGKATAALGHSQIGSVIRWGLTAAVILYLVTAHLRDMATAFDALKGEVMNLSRLKEQHDDQVKKAAEQTRPVPDTTKY